MGVCLSCCSLAFLLSSCATTRVSTAYTYTDLTPSKNLYVPQDSYTMPIINDEINLNYQEEQFDRAINTLNEESEDAQLKQETVENISEHQL